jgi:hypothetical protein
VDDPGVACEPAGGQLIREFLVGSEEQLERRTVLDLPY